MGSANRRRQADKMNYAYAKGTYYGSGKALGAGAVRAAIRLAGKKPRRWMTLAQKLLGFGPDHV